MKKILVVEDESCISSLLRMLIKVEIKGCLVLEARNGAAALELFRREDPDVVLLDIHLDDMNGKDVKKEMLRLDDNVRVILMSADSPEAKKEQGIAPFLQKPFRDLNEVAALIKDNLELSGSA